MTTTTPPPVTAGFPGMRVTQARAIRSEWTKFRSLRSTSITLAVAIALTVGIGALISAVTAARYGDMPPARKVNRTGSDGDSGYWISTRGWSLRFVA